MEYIDIFDENNNSIGKVEEKQKHIKMVTFIEQHMSGL